MKSHQQVLEPLKSSLKLKLQYLFDTSTFLSFHLLNCTSILVDRVSLD